MNYENFNRVLTHIEQHPEELDQGIWCGTSCCIAGHSKNFLGESGAGLPTAVAARKFLGLEPGLPGLPWPEWWWSEQSLRYRQAAWIFDRSRTLDDFRRIRLVACRANYAKVKS